MDSKIYSIDMISHLNESVLGQVQITNTSRLTCKRANKLLKILYEEIPQKLPPNLEAY